MQRCPGPPLHEQAGHGVPRTRGGSLFRKTARAERGPVRLRIHGRTPAQPHTRSSGTTAANRRNCTPAPQRFHPSRSASLARRDCTGPWPLDKSNVPQSMVQSINKWESASHVIAASGRTVSPHGIDGIGEILSRHAGQSQFHDVVRHVAIDRARKVGVRRVLG